VKPPPRMHSTGKPSTTEGASPLRRWLDQRTSSDSIVRAALDEPIPGGARWAYIFGSGLLFLFVSQVLTGIVLALYYVPAANDAHVTVAYIVKVVSGGSFLRSMHSYGASAMIVVLLLHIIQTFFYGSYKGRRELVWIAGCGLFALMLGMSFTGYLLPWDQKAYFATAVGTNVISEVPVLGSLVRQLLRGGNQMGTITLSRFFVLHVMVLPALIITMIVAHVYLFRKAGPAGPINEDPIHPKLPTETFYPRQVGKDMIFVLLLITTIAGLAYLYPVQLGPEANPADTAFLPRPEWYFLPVFQWLKLWPGKTVLIGVVLMPAIITFLFVAVPFLDRSLQRHPLQRPLAIGGFCVVLGGMVGFGLLSHMQDQRDPAVVSQLARQERAIRAFMRAPFVPQQIAPQQTAPQQTATAAAPAAVAQTAAPAAAATPPGATPGNASGTGQKSGTAAKPAFPAAAVSPEAQGRGLFLSHKCTDCHGDDGEGTPDGPKLTDISMRKSADQVAQSLQKPSDKALDAGMPVVPETELAALVAYLRSLRP
jgi:ubiquinol-cytochrome c reductase cytochrome b subunit